MVAAYLLWLQFAIGGVAVAEELFAGVAKNLREPDWIRLLASIGLVAVSALELVGASSALIPGALSWPAMIALDVLIVVSYLTRRAPGASRSYKTD